MTTTDRRDADDATFTAEMDRLGRLEVADTVERVARAMWEEAAGGPPSAWAWGQDGENYRRLAWAAIAALKPAPGTDSSGQAVQRVLALAEELDGEKDGFGYQVRNGLKPGPGDRIRAAVAGPQRDHGGEG